MARYTDCYWTSHDGLKLHYRDYHAGSEAAEARPPIICLPGLTRNARDFESLAEHLCENWRVLCPDLRGRGDSDYSRDASTYNPVQYVQDIAGLLDQAEVSRFFVIGTSLGGLMAMIMAPMMADRIAGAVLNDIGPVIDEAGLARIRGYVGQARSFATWMHAARGLEESQKVAYPDFEIADWLAYAKRLMVLGSNGRIVFDYDMKIAEPFNTPEGAGQVDLWPMIARLAGKPVLLVRGALSDILSADTLARMQTELPGCDTVIVDRIGHAPTLDEPEVRQAIDALLAKVA
jgi:pimeloyl-ACP methyl ester carboxylesterase